MLRAAGAAAADVMRAILRNFPWQSLRPQSLPDRRHGRNDDGRPLVGTLAYKVDDHLAVGSVERSRRHVGVQYVSVLEHGARKTDSP